MNSAASFRILIEYNYASYGRVWDSIATLSDEQFVADIDYAHGSLRNQIVHVATVDVRWVRGLTEQPEARAFNLDPADYPTRESARTLWDATETEVKAYVTSLTDEDVGRVPQGMGGPVWQVVAHLVNHGTDHRAQILRALHDIGAPTFDQDLVLYLWSP
jgi:uncharacterized damage-inducible protein DinB